MFWPKKIDIGHFLQRIEVILAFMWLLTSFIKSSVFLYIFHIMLSQAFRFRQYRAFALPAGLLIVSFSTLMSPDINHFNELNTYWPYMDGVFGFVLPTLLLVIGAIWRKKPNQ
ncbi:GerAB/ArcD/ProY family transporter [Paenibacillus sp. strain BS8-2]